MLGMSVGHSDAIDLEDALEEIFAQTRAGVAEGPVGAAIVLSSMGYDHEAILEALAARYPGIAVVGCTTNGTFGRERYMEDGVLVALLGGHGVSFRASHAVGIKEHSKTCGANAVRELVEDGARPATVIVFADPLAGAMDSLIKAMNDGLGASPPPLYGGTATDEWAFTKTLQFHGTSVFTDGVVALGIYGDVAVSCGVASGWIPVGQRMTVTKSRGPIVERINDRPTVDVFKEQFGDFLAGGMVEHPIAIFPDPNDIANFYLRTVLILDEESGSITAAGSVPEGSTVRLTTISAEKVLAGAATSVAQALDGSDFLPTCLLIVSCAARQTVLGAHAPRERATIYAELDKRGLGALPCLGLYTYGEIGAPGVGQARFHNETCVTVALGHRPTAATPEPA